MKIQIQQIINKLKKVPNYLSRFGFIYGIKLFFRVEKSVVCDSNKIEAIKAPGFAKQISLRSTISDHSAFWICMVAEQYNVDRFPNHARRLQRVYKKMLCEGKKPLIIDAGANIGMSALWFAYKYPEAYIFAIEPDRDNYELLVKNTRGLGNQIIPFFGGVWSRVPVYALITKMPGHSIIKRAKHKLIIGMPLMQSPLKRCFLWSVQKMFS